MSSLSAPSMLEATHWYDPESEALSDFNIYNEPSTFNGMLSLLQIILGVGTPLVLHLKNNPLPATVVTIEPTSTVNEPLLRICKGWLTLEINGEEVSESIVGECEFIGNIGIYSK